MNENLEHGFCIGVACKHELCPFGACFVLHVWHELDFNLIIAIFYYCHCHCHCRIVAVFLYSFLFLVLPLAHSYRILTVAALSYGCIGLNCCSSRENLHSLQPRCPYFIYVQDKVE